MIYRIHQIDDSKNCDYRFMPWTFAKDKFNLGDYHQVYEGEIEVKDGNLIDALEELFSIFNLNIPNDFRGHSLSVSDVVELKGEGLFYCDSSGWKKLEL